MADPGPSSASEALGEAAALGRDERGLMVTLDGPAAEHTGRKGQRCDGWRVAWAACVGQVGKRTGRDLQGDGDEGLGMQSGEAETGRDGRRVGELVCGTWDLGRTLDRVLLAEDEDVGGGLGLCGTCGYEASMVSRVYQGYAKTRACAPRVPAAAPNRPIAQPRS